MIGSDPAQGPAGRSGTRRAGDEYQDLAVWNGALRVLQPGRRFSSLGIEVNDAGNVDDVVLAADTGPSHYSQVKWATSAASLVGTAWLTARSGRGTSLLQKFHRSSQLLSPGTLTARLELLTNRALDHSDPLLALVDGRTNLLMPAAAALTEHSKAGQRLHDWVVHLKIPTAELLPMLEHLCFRTGRDICSEQERAMSLMAGLGLTTTQDALRRGIDAVGQWIVAGRKRPHATNSPPRSSA